jgi:hypothetical protein
MPWGHPTPRDAEAADRAARINTSRTTASAAALAFQSGALTDAEAGAQKVSVIAHRGNVELLPTGVLL